MKDRILWVDYAKFIGIYLVVLGHLPININLVVFIYSFHIPLFFFLSGYLYKIADSMNSNFKYNIRTLIIPYILLYCIYWIYPIIKGLINNTFTWTENIIKPFWGLCLGNGYSGAGYTMLNVPLYFLMALFWVRVLFYFYNRFACIGFKVIILLSCVIFIIIKKHIGFELYLSIDSAIMAFPFFVLGYSLMLKKWIMLIHHKRWLVFLVIIVTILLEYLLCIYNGRVDVNHCLYGNSVFLFYISGVVGILMIVAFSSLFGRLSFIQILSNGTILIIAFGTASASFILFVLQIWDINSDVKNMFSALGALILLYPVIKLAQKHFPILLGKRKH